MKKHLYNLFAEFYGCDPQYYGVEAEPLAEFLIDKGVIVPPLKAGQLVWYVTQVYGENPEIYKGQVDRIIIDKHSVWIMVKYEGCSQPMLHTPKAIGKSIFLTEEEAQGEVIQRSLL